VELGVWGVIGEDRKAFVRDREAEDEDGVLAGILTSFLAAFP